MISRTPALPQDCTPTRCHHHPRCLLPSQLQHMYQLISHPRIHNRFQVNGGWMDTQTYPRSTVTTTVAETPPVPLTATLRCNRSSWITGPPPGRYAPVQQHSRRPLSVPVAAVGRRLDSDAHAARLGAPGGSEPRYPSRDEHRGWRGRTGGHTVLDAALLLVLTVTVMLVVGILACTVSVVVHSLYAPSVRRLTWMAPRAGERRAGGSGGGVRGTRQLNVQPGPGAWWKPTGGCSLRTAQA